MFQKQMFWH